MRAITKGYFAFKSCDTYLILDVRTANSPSSFSSGMGNAVLFSNSGHTCTVIPISVKSAISIIPDSSSE